MQHRTIAALFLGISLCIGSASAQEKGFGLGVILGEPTGISGKLWNGRTTAFNGAVAWSFEKNNAFHLHLDHVFHNQKIIEVEKGRLPVYYGIGGRVRFDDDDVRIALRIPVGINYQFADAPVDLFFEIVPLLDLIPSTEFDFNGGIGVRYFF